MSITEKLMRLGLKTAQSTSLCAQLSAVDYAYGDLGSFGAKLKQAFTQTGCTEEINDTGLAEVKMEALASYNPREKKIYYSKKCEGMPFANLMEIRAHEVTHAIQYSTTPCAKASITNIKTNILLCPKDEILLHELMEWDAYFKGFKARALYTCAGQTGNLSDIPSAQNIIDKVSDFLEGNRGERRNAYNRHILTALNKYAINTATMKRCLSSTRLQAVNIFNQLAGQFKNFSPELLAGVKKDHEDLLQNIDQTSASLQVTYARLEPEDIVALGNSFDINIFIDEKGRLKEKFSHLAPLSPKNKKLLDDTNAMLGIANEDSLPTFGEALAQKGLDRSAFLRLCRA